MSATTSVTPISQKTQIKGSVWALWSLSLPLMLSLMSSSCMFFLDRLFLATYSIESLNASVNAGSFAVVFQFGLVSIATITEVFVGQANGAGKHHQIGQVVWQMIWFSLATLFFLPPLGFILSPFLFAGNPEASLEILFFKWVMGFGPFFCLGATLSCFYIGRGKVRFITAMAILANGLNILLDWIFIFGLYPIIPEYGIAGAAIATGISEIFFCAVLLVAFLSKKNHDLFATRKMSWKGSVFWQAIRVGFPNSLAHSIELFAWALFFKMMIAISDAHMTVVSVAQSIFFLFTFITEAVSKAATALAANLFGGKKWDQVPNLFQGGVKFYIIMFLSLSPLLALYPDPLLDWFLSKEFLLEHPQMKNQLISACFWVWIFFLFDGIHWLQVGLLTAAKDTTFVLKAGGSTIWLFAILPIYVFVFCLEMGPDIAWGLIAFYGLVNCIVYYLRLRWILKKTSQSFPKPVFP